MRVFVMLVAVLWCAPLAAQARVTVRPHVTRQGVYVPRHRRTAPNHSRLDNWSTRGRKNPWTGRKGTRPIVEPPRKPRRPSLTR